MRQPLDISWFATRTGGLKQGLYCSGITEDLLWADRRVPSFPDRPGELFEFRPVRVSFFEVLRGQLVAASDLHHAARLVRSERGVQGNASVGTRDLQSLSPGAGGAGRDEPEPPLEL